VSISPTFYEQLLRRNSLTKKLQSQTVIREKLQKTLLHKKTACKIFACKIFACKIFACKIFVKLPLCGI